MVASKDAKGKPPTKPAGKGGKDDKSTDESVKLIIFQSKIFFLFTSNLHFLVRAYQSRRKVSQHGCPNVRQS